MHFLEIHPSVGIKQLSEGKQVKISRLIDKKTDAFLIKRNDKIIAFSIEDGEKQFYNLNILLEDIFTYRWFEIQI